MVSNWFNQWSRDVKLRENSTFGKHLLVFPEYINYIGRKFLVTLMANVAVIYLLSSAPFAGTFWSPLIKFVFHRRHVIKGCLIKLIMRSLGMS